MPYTTVVFDLDGTLLNTAIDLTLAVNHALEAFGLPRRAEEKIISFTGNGIVRLVERSVPEGTSRELWQKVFDEFKSWYGEHALDHTLPYEGIPQMIAALREAGIKCAVVSNKADYAVQEIIASRMAGCFDAVLGECEERGIAKKPAADMVDAVLAQMGRVREGLAYVGDSEVDVATAASCGCPCVACTWGFRTREELAAAGAQTIVDTPAELQRVLLGNEG
ncbi:HAD family hydrolase [Paratractidigestivibacter sp.]|uniref:HAD family hydrolase n=1 Tax=Paratractidigestivibacter sp. TaxID=2847316 RepID=UPI002ABDC623|nr:HAD hydrolase-like protein [Paratractidigestivibacter sp.]